MYKLFLFILFIFTVFTFYKKSKTKKSCIQTKAKLQPLNVIKGVFRKQVLDIPVKTIQHKTIKYDKGKIKIVDNQKESCVCLKTQYNAIIKNTEDILKNGTNNKQLFEKHYKLMMYFKCSCSNECNCDKNKFNNKIRNKINDLLVFKYCPIYMFGEELINCDPKMWRIIFWKKDDKNNIGYLGHYKQKFD